MSEDIVAIAFDKDGVIFDSESIYQQTLLQTLAQYKLPFDETFAAQFQGMAAPKSFEVLTQAIRPHMDVDTFITTWLGKKEAVYEAGGLPFIAGTPQVIKDLYAQGYPLALVTSDSHENVVTDFAITEPALLSCFSVVISLDDVNQAKPNPEPYQRAATLLGVPSQQLLVLEDSDLGAMAASDAGAKVLLYRPQGEVDSKIQQRLVNVIHHPSQLLDYLS